MYRFKSSVYLATGAVLIAVMVAIAYLTSYLVIIPGTKGIFQLSDSLLLLMSAIIAGPLMIIVGVISGSLIDLITGAVQFIPITIVIHGLMAFIVLAWQRKLTPYGAIAVASCLTLLYIPYSFMINLISGIGHATIISAVIIESINDLVQMVISLMLGCIIYHLFNKYNVKSNYNLWDDRKFDRFKANEQTDKEMVN